MSEADAPNGAAFKSGFIAILGAPNVGKSTLLNRLLGQKLSITSKKPQTTRNRILGILHRPAAQLVFLDTPGVHRASKALNVRIVEAALSVLADVDLVLLVSDASTPDAEAEQILLKRLTSEKKPVILALNKIDRVAKPALLDRLERWSREFDFQALIPISAKHGTQVDALVAAMEQALPSGPPLFPSDHLTDRPVRFVAAELIREKAFRLTGAELPYAIAVTVDTFTETPKLVAIQATLHVERNSQKGILIGQKGSKLKAIGEQARLDIERLVGCKVFLKLFVRVQKNWSRDTKALQRFGY